MLNTSIKQIAVSAFSPQQSRVKVGFPLQWPVCAKSPCLYGDMWCSVAAFLRSALKGPSRATPAWIRIPTSPALDYLLSQCTSAPIFPGTPESTQQFSPVGPSIPTKWVENPIPCFFLFLAQELNKPTSTLLQSEK